MIVLVGAISAVFAFGVVVLLRLVIRFVFRLISPPKTNDGTPTTRGISSLFTAPEFRPDRIALAASTALLVILLGVYALVLSQV
jgi:hypothetical protein